MKLSKPPFAWMSRRAISLKVSVIVTVRFLSSRTFSNWNLVRHPLEPTWFISLKFCCQDYLNLDLNATPRFLLNYLLSLTLQIRFLLQGFSVSFSKGATIQMQSQLSGCTVQGPPSCALRLPPRSPLGRSHIDLLPDPSTSHMAMNARVWCPLGRKGWTHVT